MFSFVCFDFIFVLYQEVDIVQAVHQTMLLVGIDFKLLGFAGRLVGDGLFRQINLHLCLRVGIDGIEQLLKERFADDHRQHEVVQFVVLVDVGKETADHDPESISGDCPCGMFTAGTASEVLACY